MRRVSAFLRRHLPTMLKALIFLAVVVVVWSFSAPIAQWLRSAQSFDAVAFLGEHLLVVGIVGSCLLLLALVWLPKWQAARPELTSQARFEVENNARKTLAEIVGGAALLMGLYFTWSSLEVNREGQVTERFTKAIDHLGAVNAKGEKQLEIRLGGIYALERIARDSKKDQWPVMEVLTAYVREHAPWSPKPPKDTPPPQDNPSFKGIPAVGEGQPPPKLATDIQAVLTVLGRRDRTYEKADQRLDLSGTDLRGAQLTGANLEKADLRQARLEKADLTGAHLQGANLYAAHLEKAILKGAHLQGAKLIRTHLEEADLYQARLEKANLQRAYLQGAALNSAHLEEAYLPAAHLEGAAFWDSHLEGATLAKAHLQGPGVAKAEILAK